jgi:peptidoglycan/LPS O-acetylase OafA/YrhL
MSRAPDAPEVGRPFMAGRLGFLDGIRALAAMFVVLHHMYITVYPGFPHNTGPWFLGWLLYGHFGVAVFIVVSGFSLTLAPARRDNQLGSSYGRFMSRRAWRIIPPYWAALVASVVIMAGLVNLRIHDPVELKGVITHFFLVQDVFSGKSPNGAFWSIAVEFQLYFLFPLFLWSRRRLGPVVTAVGGTAAVCLVYAAGQQGHGLRHLLNLSPQFAALFIFGIVAAGATVRPDGSPRRVPWGWLSIGLATVVVIGCVVAGTVRVSENFYWGDLVVGTAVACGLAALVEGSGRVVRQVLQSRAIDGVGQFSYSLYLMHEPLLLLGYLFVVVPLHLSRNASFALMVFGIGPLVLAGCYVFYLAFERPFLTRRSFAAWFGWVRGSLPQMT